MSLPLTVLTLLVRLTLLMRRGSFKVSLTRTYAEGRGAKIAYNSVQRVEGVKNCRNFAYVLNG